MTLQLGKAPARPGAVSFSFNDFVDMTQMPPPPASFGRDRLVKQWGMKGNDVAGDCVFAGAAHEIMLWNAEVGKTVRISDKTALLNYSKVTDYDPEQTDPATGENPTDRGTDVAQWLSIRRKQGFIDDDGVAHKIGAYIALQPGNIDQLRYAAYYFDGVGVGINFPQQWMDVFTRGGRTWPALRNPDYVGGHYIACVAWRDHRPVFATWGAEVEIATAGIVQTCDEAYAYLSLEKITKGVDPNGIDVDKLTSYLKGLKGVR